MLPVYSYVGLFVETSIRHFFTNHQPCLLGCAVHVCKLRLHCHVFNIAPPTCVSVNCVKILLNVIRSSVHKTVV